MYYVDPCDAWFGPLVVDWAFFYRFGIAPDDLIEGYPQLGNYRADALCCAGCDGWNDVSF